MTIRRERNRGARRVALQIAAGYRCPDCKATTALTEAAPGVLVLEVAHDETCPNFTAITRSTA